MPGYSWTFLKRIRRGHAFWRDQVSGRVAIADDSTDGPPDTSDDGVLWLDRSRPLRISVSCDGRMCLSLPLLDLDQEQTQSPIGLAEAKYVMRQHAMELYVSKIGRVVLAQEERDG